MIMDTSAKIVTEALRLWKDDGLTIPEAIRQAKTAIPASPAAQDRAGQLVWASVARIRARRATAINALAARLGGGLGLAEAIDAWLEGHRWLRRPTIDPGHAQLRRVLLELEAEIASHLRPEVVREFSARLEMQQ
jgi:hypothetical protein